MASSVPPGERQIESRVERELASIEIAPLTLGAVTHFGRLKAELRTRGIAKSDLDLLIAASALDLGATLVTHDQAPPSHLSTTALCAADVERAPGNLRHQARPPLFQQPPIWA